LVSAAERPGDKSSDPSQIGEAAQETDDVEQGTPIGPTTLLAGQITEITHHAAMV
jgi:hypothetical protein